MNVVREISRINQAELDIAIRSPSASWHQQYNDSAYIFIGGLPYDLTEGDVVTIFSQYGEVVDVNLPRANPTSTCTHANNNDNDDRNRAASSSQQSKPLAKGKHRGFGFLMYQDQRSTVLAVDNLNGAQVLGRTLRVDHVASYKQPKVTDEQGNRVEADVKSLNAAPVELDVRDNRVHDLAQDDDADLQDPMAAYFQRRNREQNLDLTHDPIDERDEKRRRKQERARIRAERDERRRKHASASGTDPRDHASSSSSDRCQHSASHRDDANEQHREPKPHPSYHSARGYHRKQGDHAGFSQASETSEPEDDAINRYERSKTSRSVLDMDRASDSKYAASRSRSRSRSPPRSSRHPNERSSRQDQHGHRRRHHHTHRPATSSSHHHRSSRQQSSSYSS